MAKDVPPHENLANSRYTDLTGEPVARLLSPIKGYEAAPLVSLEQAIAPITHLFDCIEENVWVAKENSKNPPDGLTQDESAAIHLYTMQFDTDPNFYGLLNSTLRGENRDNLKPWFSYLKLFLTALYKLESHPQTIWRGVRGVDLSKQYPTGSKFAWWGVSSCTSSLEVLQAETFLGRKGLRTLFSIESQNGKIIVPHSYFKDTEKEIVLMPGTYFEVVGQVSPADDLYIIQLKELDPPFAFVKPPFKRDPSIQKISKPSDDIAPSKTYSSDSDKISDQSAITSSNNAYMTNQQSQVPNLNNFGMGGSNFGMGGGNFGMGGGSFGMGGGSFGMGGGNFGMNPGNFGAGFTHVDPFGTSAVTNPRAESSATAQGTNSTLPKARIVNSNLQPQMQETVVGIIQNAVVEGEDEEDIKLIIVDELVRKYGGTFWVTVSPKSETHGFVTTIKSISVKIDKYSILVIQK